MVTVIYQSKVNHALALREGAEVAKSRGLPVDDKHSYILIGNGSTLGVVRDCDVATSGNNYHAVVHLSIQSLEEDKTCYQCGEPVLWLAPDSRCGKCTRLTPSEVMGVDSPTTQDEFDF